MRSAMVTTTLLLIGSSLAACGGPDDEVFETTSAALRLNTGVGTTIEGDDTSQDGGFCGFLPCLNTSGLNVPGSFDLPAPGRLRQVRIWSGSYIDGIELSWLDPKNPQDSIQSAHIGGYGGTKRTLSLDPDEAIIGVELHTGRYVDFIAFSTNKRQHMTWGGSGGTNRPVSLRPGAEIHGLRGFSGKYIDGIGFWTYLP